MANSASAIKAYPGPQEAVNSVKIGKKPLVEYATNYVSRLYDKGFYALADPYITGDKRIILNRSRGAESNFFAIVEVGPSSVTSYFTDPRTGEDGIGLKKDDVIVKQKYGGGVLRFIFGGYGNPAKGLEAADKTIETSNLKPINEYRCYLHSHLGSVLVNGKEEVIWGDGRTEDKDWILHTILAHGDVHALTEHNWTQKEERLMPLKERLGAANIVFIPGWENTTTTVYPNPSAEDLVKAPHILCYCANIEMAMKVKQEFLMKKLRTDTPITPIFCGVPAPFDEHIEFMRKYHDQGLIGVVIAHPFSLMPGIDLCDPNNINKLGMEKIKSVFAFADGVEMYNGGENHSKLNIDLTSKKDYGGLARWVRYELDKRHMPLYPSAPNLNQLMGKMAEEGGKHSIYGQDDHLLRDIGPDCISLYNQGHTRLVVPEQAFGYLKGQGRKITSEEFVHLLIRGTLEITNEATVLRAIAFANSTGDGPDIVEARKDGAVGKVLEKIRSLPYYANVVKLTIQHLYAKNVLKDEKKIEEIAKELEKEKSYNLKPPK